MPSCRAVATIHEIARSRCVRGERALEERATLECALVDGWRVGLALCPPRGLELAQVCTQRRLRPGELGALDVETLAPKRHLLELACELRGVRLERRHHVLVRGGVERRLDRVAPLRQHPAGPRDPPLQDAQLPHRRGELLCAATRQLGGRGRRLDVERAGPEPQLADVGLDRAKRRGQLALALGQRGMLLAVEEASHRAQLGGELRVRAGRGCLALERTHLTPHLAHKVSEALEVLLGGSEATLGALLASTVLEHARRLLDDAASLLGSRVEHLIELTLADDHVLLSADARVTQQLLDVEQPAGRAVDRVLGLAVTEQRSRDRDLGEVDGKPPRGVVDRQAHFGPAQCGTRRRPREDDVLHLLAAQRARALGAEHPRGRVDDVRLPRAVRAHDDGDPGLELEGGRVRERLEALDAEALQEHRTKPTARRTRFRGPCTRR